MMNCPASLALAILLTIQGVCGQGWNVTYQPESICAFVGASVNMSCSYTYPSYLTIKHTYWSKESSPNPPDLMVNPDYRDRATIGCQQGANICHLHIESLTMLDTGKYYCSITTKTLGKKLIGATGVYLDIKNTPLTSVSISPSGDIQEGTEVRLTCNSSSDRPVQSHWYKDDLSTTPVHLETGHTYTVKHFRQEHSGRYFCYSTFKCGYAYSPSVYLQVVYSPKNTTVSLSYLVSTAVITVSVCGAVGLFCLVFFMSKTWKKEATRTRQERSMNPSTTQPDAVYQSLNPNTTQPDAVYQSLNSNTTQPDADYQSLNPNNTQPDAVYQNLNLNTTQLDAVYQSLNPNTTPPNALTRAWSPTPPNTRQFTKF
ncbi:uncharacterized protein LOC121719522 [Alosa sapidissima]|uniref:uncharacterized protein LOC121719522 n=1 Tax=Alosa sapidissima TaxID=34773 RepID=UPI001C09FE93|nr:uncharacterized protein LOC121719522 [Alosa sapidissima]